MMPREFTTRARLARPYMLTGGRTRSAGADLAIETLIVTSELAAKRITELEAEEREIASLCELPRSLAEVSALIHLPLGVSRVLVGDMVGDGLLNVQQHIGDIDVGVLERLLDGLRSL
jgi:hypothetical protein